MTDRLLVLARLAWRNLWRNRRRTSIMLAAITVGVWAMIFMTALSQGMVTEMVESGIETLPGHVQVHHPRYLDDPTVANLLPLPGAKIESLLDDAETAAWLARVRVPAVVSSERETRGVTLLGIDPSRELGVIFVSEDDIEGRFLEGADDEAVVIGAALAATLDTGIGKRIVLMSQTPGNEIADRGFRIAGLYRAQTETLEERFVFAGLTTVQAMLGIGDRVSEVALFGDDYRNPEPLVARARALFGDDVDVEPWTALDPYLDTMLSVMDGFVLVWVVVVFLALSFGLVNTLVMAVFERVREIGLMLALGMRPAMIIGQVVIESMLLLSIGLAAGNLVAWFTILPLEDGIDLSVVGEGLAFMGAGSVLYPDLRAADMLLATGVVLVLGFLASLSPAWRASRYEPVEAITRVKQ